MPSPNSGEGLETNFYNKCNFPSGRISGVKTNEVENRPDFVPVEARDSWEIQDDDIVHSNGDIGFEWKQKSCV